MLAQDLPVFVTENLWVREAWRDWDGYLVVGEARAVDSARALRHAAEIAGYQVNIKREGAGLSLELHQRALRRNYRERLGLKVLLFFVTFVSVAMAGAVAGGYNPFESFATILTGVPFALTLMITLLVHESSHYVAGVRHHLPVSLPYFIPVPPPVGFGTAGAIIAVRGRYPDRRALLDLGVSGPFAGFLVALPMYMVGLSMPASTMALAQEQIYYGNSILTAALQDLFQTASNTPNTIALAGWFGLFLTGFNLLPVGQLDGGHVGYALWGKAAGLVSRSIFVLILLMSWMWLGYVMVAAAFLFMLRLDHPTPADDYSGLDPKRILLGYLAMFIMIICFPPIPVYIGGV